MNLTNFCPLVLRPMQSIKPKQRPASTYGQWKHKTAAAKSQEGQSIWKQETRADQFFCPSGIVRMTPNGKLKETGWYWAIYKVKDEFYCSGILLESPLIWLCRMALTVVACGVWAGKRMSLPNASLYQGTDIWTFSNWWLWLFRVFNRKKRRELRDFYLVSSFIHSYVCDLLCFLWWCHDTDLWDPLISPHDVSRSVASALK